MESNEVFEAVSHPLRIKILMLLARRPMSFSELKRELGIRSSGKLDFHIKKLDGLVALDDNGKYVLTKEGYAALQAIDTIRKYGWQKRTYIIATIAYAIAILYTTWNMVSNPSNPVYIVTAALITLWYIFYSYWSIVKRKIFKTL
ncbi:winged helix-turn-helix transcriptional regulator [Desulfurococcaceae archaeon MEX13E-LK6-19]|nr:winged helix-turn-helix transcriptional regulator [Desulfurococcaceae archaeon MEX13E-LK6-19]